MAARKSPRSKLRGTGPFARFEWMIAARYLRPRRREAFISVIAVLSFVGIMLGVATLIVVMAVMNGFRAQLIDKILGLNGHFIVQAMDTKLTDYDAVAERIVAVPGVVSAIPLIEGQALASGLETSSGALVRGVRDQDLDRIPGIAGNVRLGTLDGFSESEGVAIGTRLAAALGLTLGDTLTLVSPRGNVTPLGVTPRIKPYPVVAVFEIGMSEYDSTFIFMPFEEAQIYFNQEGVATAVEIYLDDPDAIDALRPAIEAAAQRQILLGDWRQRNATFFSALEVERNVMFLILLLIVLVAALNIISGLIMLVKDKGPRHRHSEDHGGDAWGDHAGVLHHRGGDRHPRDACRICPRRCYLPERRADPPISFAPDAHGRVFAGAVFPQSVARRHGSERNHGGRRPRPDLVVSCHALSGLACGAPRPGRGAA